MPEEGGFDSAKKSILETELLSLLQNHFMRMNNKNRQLLTLCINGTPCKDTAQIMGFTSTDYVKTRKFMCKEKLKRCIQLDPCYNRITMELFDN